MLEFAFLKQVHGTNIIEQNCASSGVTSADGHWTSQSHLALVIQTADCNPILWDNGSRVYALHAGWRGVEQKIVSRALTSDPTPPRDVFLGPSILFESFEVKHDISKRLTSTLTENEKKLIIAAHPDTSKYYVDLRSLIKREFSDTGMNPTFTESPENTILDDNYFSYRRQAELPGRNLSFIAKLSKTDKIDL